MPSTEGRDGGRFFVIHLQKTGGVSLLRRLQHHFGERAVYPDSSDGATQLEPVISVEHLRERLRTRGDEIKVITGHFPLCTVELVGGGFTTVTILRDPVERTLSYLRHHLKETPEDRDKRLEDVYADPYRFHGLVHNHMTKMLSLTADEARDWMQKVVEMFFVPQEQTAAWMLTQVEFTPERLERAKQGLASVDAFGFTERFEELCDDLSHRFGWDLGPPKHENESEPAEVSHELRARIAKDNAMDIELYEFAQRLYRTSSR
jgi:hypothetical protein